MIDELDSDCPDCKRNAAVGDCACDGGDLMSAGVERSVEFMESGRARTAVPRRKGSR